MGKLSKSKARKILEDGTVRGHPLSKKQKKFFGAIAGGAKPKGKKKKAKKAKKGKKRTS